MESGDVKDRLDVLFFLAHAAKETNTHDGNLRDCAVFFVFYWCLFGDVVGQGVKLEHAHLLLTLLDRVVLTAAPLGEAELAGDIIWQEMILGHGVDRDEKVAYINLTKKTLAHS